MLIAQPSGLVQLPPQRLLERPSPTLVLTVPRAAKHGGQHGVAIAALAVLVEF
jgi:hypothetical protein